MRMILRGLLAASLLFPGGARAQEPAPYAGMQTRAVKALSAADTEALLAGEGLGLALSAELNGLPGPRHTLDLADSLALSAAQRVQVQAIFDAMQAHARELGARILAAEQALDRGFAERTLAAGDVAPRTTALGALWGELRAVHLAAHIETSALLSHAQIRRYGELRGYGGHHGHTGH